ncbi:MAG: hypothetical protein FJX76_18480 [Armatimonadetes bacterium]|nr:hypothetical protein [Armatimonadota bacterium]
MSASLHNVEIDIFQVPYRPCRAYQERIAEYYMSGRPRFEWEKMRQKFLMEGNQDIVRVCAPCPMNILGTGEGCKIGVESLASFLGMLSHLRPETALTRFMFHDDLLSYEDVKVLWQEFETLNEVLAEVSWPIAQAYDDGVPRPSSAGGLRKVEYYEWEGGEENIIYSNAGYMVGIGRDGIVVRESLGKTLPERFNRLFKEGANVFGETVGNRVMPFMPIDDHLPAWDDSGPFIATELRFHMVPVTEIYGDILETFLVYAPTALEHGAGLKITAVG